MLRYFVRGAAVLVAIPVIAAIPIHFYRPHSSFAQFARAEDKLLQQHITKNSYSLKDIPISNGNSIHTLIINEAGHKKEKPNLVLMHGWSSGLALWAKNIDELAVHYNVYALDLLGFGRSSRPPFPCRATPEEAKAFWVESFHEWKENVFGDQPITLLGHSLGGFISCTYAIERPDHLTQVLLAAPVGLAPFLISEQKGWVRKGIQSLIWDIGVTPQLMLRSFGWYSYRIWNSLGERSGYRGLDKDSWEYLYQAQMAAGSGERAFMKIMLKDGWSYPLYDRLKELNVPMKLIYGERDYIRHEFIPEIMKEVPTATFSVIPKAGHHLYWSHTRQFNDAIIHSKESNKM